MGAFRTAVFYVSVAVVVVLTTLTACQPQSNPESSQPAGNEKNSSPKAEGESIDAYALTVGSSCVISQSVPIMSTPGEGSPKGQISAGSTIQVVSISQMDAHPWYFVKRGGSSGWVSAEKLADQELRQP